MTDATGTPAIDPSAMQLRIVRGNPTDEEIAALTAVLGLAVAERAARIAESAPVARVPSAWERTRRNLRGTVSPGPGHWRGFSG